MGGPAATPVDLAECVFKFAFLRAKMLRDDKQIIFALHRLSVYIVEKKLLEFLLRPGIASARFERESLCNVHAQFLVLSCVQHQPLFDAILLSASGSHSSRAAAAIVSAAEMKSW